MRKIKRLKIQAPKSVGGQLRYRGIGMTRAEEACALKCNELVKQYNKFFSLDD